MKSLISVVVPVYNAENTIEQCVNSIMRQTYSNLEIILVNDGSKDKSIEFCRKLQKEDNRIIVINKENEGVSKTRNRGLDIAKGEYIVFVDSDDFIENNMIEIMYNNIQNYDMCTCNYYAIKNNKKIIKANIESYTIEDGKINEYIEKMQKEMLFYNPVNKIFKASIIKENNIRFEYNIHVGEDYLFNIEYIKYVKRAKYISQPLYNYIIQRGTLSQKYIERSIPLEMKIVRNIKEIYEDRSFDMTYIYNQYMELLKSNIYNLQIGKKNGKEIKKFIEEYRRELEKDKIIKKEIKNKLSKENKILYLIILKNKINYLVEYFKIRFILKKIIKG